MAKTKKIEAFPYVFMNVKENPITIPANSQLTIVAEIDGNCDDGNAAVNPGANEVCADGIDNDCDGDVDKAECL